MKKIFLILILLGTVFAGALSSFNDRLLKLGIDDFETDYSEHEQNMERKLKELIGKILDPALFVIDARYRLQEAPIFDSSYVSVEKYQDGVKGVWKGGGEAKYSAFLESNKTPTSLFRLWMYQKENVALTFIYKPLVRGYVD